MNKQVKKFRTTVRNKQTHAVTAAYVELVTTYKLIESRQHEPVKAQFLDLLMDAFQDIEDEIEAEQIALDDAAAECEAECEARDIFEEEGEDSQVEAPDVFCNAMLDLLKNDASNSERCNSARGYDSNYDD